MPTPKPRSKSKTVLRQGGQQALPPRPEPPVSPVQSPPAPAPIDLANEGSPKPAPVWNQANKSLEGVARPRLAPAQPTFNPADEQPHAVAPHAVAPHAVAPHAVAPHAVAPQAVAPQAVVAASVANKPVQGVLPSQIVREAQGHRGSQGRGGASPRGSRWKWQAWVGAGLGAAMLVVGGAAAGAYSHFAASEAIAPNVFIGEVPVGGLTLVQACARVRSHFGSPRVSLRCGGKIVRLPLARLGGGPTIEPVVRQAYGVGRSGFLPANLMRVYSTNGNRQTLVLPMHWNVAQTRVALQQVNAQVAQAPVDARLRAGRNGLEVVPDQAGRAIDLDAAAPEIRRRFRVGVSSIGVPMRLVKAKVAARNLEGRDVQLAGYTTHFNAGIAGRTENIRIACRAIQNHVLMPGETFSFNACTGERTARKGYQMAHIFLRQPGEDEPEVAEGLAGGVCQVSSTLFNAVRKTNAKALVNPIKIVERNTHSLPVTYVPHGLDATVAWPGKDFKFRNITDHPVYVRAQMGRSKLSISIWNRVPRA